MVKYKFNDNAVAPHIETIASLGIKRHVLEYEQIMKIKELLNIDELDIEELRAVRNSVVKLFNEKEDEQKTYEEADRYHYAMSGTVMVIDSRMWDLGGGF